MDDLAFVAPAFVELAHQIVWATAATVDLAGKPMTRILHPVWEWDGTTITGRIATSPLSPKAAHLDRVPMLSLTYWRPDHATCTARCRTSWDSSLAGRVSLWNRFRDAPEPLGYDPTIVPAWESPSAPTFGVLQLEPIELRVLDQGLGGRRLAWKS